MKKLLATILIGILAMSFVACSNNKSNGGENIRPVMESSQSVGDIKSTLVPEKSEILTEGEGSLFLEVKMTYEETVKFYDDAVKTLGAEGEFDDMGSSEEIWAFTGTYSDNELLSITISPSDDDSCSVSIHY